MKKFMAILIGIAVPLTFLGCAAPSGVAQVNGVAITQEEYVERLDASLTDYGMTSADIVEQMGEEQAQAYKAAVVDDLVAMEVLLQKAGELGLAEFTAEEEALIEQGVDDSMSSLFESIKQEVTTEVEGDATANIDGIARQRYNEQLEAMGVTRESLIENQKKSLIINKLYDDQIKNYEMTEQDAKLYYDENVRRLEEQDAADPQAAFTDYTGGSQEIELYVPSLAATDAMYVKHVLIKIPDEKAAEIQALKTEGKEEEAQAMLKEALEEIRPTAEEVLKKAQDGGDFDQLITEYGEDPGMAANPDGYLVYEGASFVENFLNAALKLEKVGDIAPKIVETEYGYHIIMLASRPVPGAVPYEEVSAEILNTIGQQRAAEYWNSLMEEWIEAAEVEKYELP